MREIKCSKHKEMEFSIPENIEECVSLNSFQEIKLLENHLENNPDCKMISKEDFNW